MDSERHCTGYAANRQLAREDRFVRAGQFDLLSRERNLRIFLHVEKVRAFKVGITRRFACPDSSSFDCGLDRSRARVRRIEDQRAVDIFEMAANKSHHHVPHTKSRRRMPRFKKPFGHGPLPSREDSWSP